MLWPALADKVRRCAGCSASFALRSWLYILLHAVVAAPAAWFQEGALGGKAAVFVCTRTALGAVSAATEALLHRWA